MPPLLWRIAEFKAKNLGVGPQIGGFTPLPGVYLRVFGVTKNSSGVAIGNCTVHLFRTSDDVEVDQVISDVAGNYEFRSVSLATTYYVVAYQASGYRTTMLATVPSGYWRHGEPSGTVATDVMGANPGTYVNTPTLGAAGLLTGDPDTAVTFAAASSQYVNVPDATALDLGDGPYSYAAWIRRTVLGVSGTIMGKGSGAPVLQFETPGNRLRFFNRAIALAAISTVQLNSTSATYFVVGTRSGATWKIYINGVDQTATEDTGGTTANNVSDFNIGRDTGLSDYFDGTIDEAAIWSRTLSPGEIAALYAAGTTVTTDLAGTTVNTLVGS